MSDKIISLLDYGISNIKSLSNALNKIGVNHEIIQNLNNTENSKVLIIPGVGSFPKAISILKEKEIFSQIQSYAKSKKPILGICLGMQILFSKSYEFEETEGLNLIEGSVKKIPEENVKLPNIGWRKLLKKDKLNYFKINYKNNFYFVHSYYVDPKNIEVIKYFINYQEFQIPAIVQYKNIYGFQFHPEKSGEEGLVLLKNFFKSILNTDK